MKMYDIPLELRLATIERFRVNIIRSHQTFDFFHS